jgi:ABC-type glycerol-3-phosphate transport system substrate-binding protein
VEQAAPERLDRPAIRFAAPRDDLLAYQELAQRFEQEKGIRVDLVAREDLIDSARSENSMLWTQMRQIANRADALAGPEVAALVRSGRSDGILHDLTSLASTLPAEDFFPNTLESLQWRGSARAVPARVSAHLILYNQWMFDQMGVPYPEVGWTWNDFDRVVEAVTSRGADKLKWAGFRDGPGGLPVLLMSRLPALVDYTGDSARPGWGGSEAVDALRWYGGLAQRGALLPPGAGETEAPATSAPADAAMWVAPVELSALAGLRQGQIGAVPFPVNERGDPTNPIEVLDAYAISASSERVAAAWEWIQYLLKRDAGTSALRAGVSAQRALVALAAGDGESGRIYRYALEHARRLDALRPEEYMMQQALRQAVIDVVARRTEPELAVQKALGALHRPGDP